MNLRITRLMPLLFAISACAVQAPTPTAKPATACAADWLEQHKETVSEVYRGQVNDPKALLEEVAKAVTDADGVIKQRREVNDTFHLTASLNADLDVESLIEAHGPTWEHREQSKQEQPLIEKCEKLDAARAVSARLEDWLAEDHGHDEHKYVQKLHRDHKEKVRHIQEQVDRAAKSNEGRHLRLNFSKTGTTPRGRFR